MTPIPLVCAVLIASNKSRFRTLKTANKRGGFFMLAVFVCTGFVLSDFMLGHFGVMHNQLQP